MNYNKKQTYIIYVVYDEEEDPVYVGSSGLPINLLEYNHRHYKEKGYSETKFRKALAHRGQNWTFRVERKQLCTREQIEELEGEVIKRAHPKYNVDLDPLNSSKYYGRL